MSSMKQTHNIDKVTEGDQNQVSRYHHGKNAVVKVILLANGIGSNPQSYRPNADESQWWNRRDALVRCVTSFFFCATNSCTHNEWNRNNQNGVGSDKELIILFDEDWSYFSMKYVPSTTGYRNGHQHIPSECNIIQLWKCSAQNPGVRIRNNDLGLSCLCINSTTAETKMTKNLESVMLLSNNNNNNNNLKHQTNKMVSTTSSDTVGNIIDSTNKRSILEYLQSTCSMEFLRLHKLNSSIETLARKTNKTKLLEIKRIWDIENDSKKRKISSISSSPSEVIATPSSSITRNTNTSVPNGEFSFSLQSFVQHIIQPQSTDVDKVIAVTLHESSQNEFPCWDDDEDDNGIPDKKSVQICFFLGAVRDMYKNENRTLRQVCDQNHVPLLRIRFGPVSEFTSKILSVLSYHTSNHPRIQLGCDRIIVRNQRQTNDAITASNEARIGTDPTLLHFICHIPTTSGEVTTNLSHRNRIMWCMVRCTVTCLWRSRLASGKNKEDNNSTTTHHAPPKNRLSFIFNDGIVLTIDQNDLVVDMAANHQAAPSEYQILATIRKKLDTVQSQVPETKQGDRLLPSTLHNSLFYDTKQNHLHCPSIYIDLMSPKNPSNYNSSFYKSVHFQNNSKVKAKTQMKTLSQVVAICIGVRSDTVLAAQELLRSKIHQAIIHACEINSNDENLIRVSGHELINMDDCVDEEGASITMIQHLVYQRRLVNLCHKLAIHDTQTINV